MWLRLITKKESHTRLSSFPNTYKDNPEIIEIKKKIKKSPAAYQAGRKEDGITCLN